SGVTWSQQAFLKASNAESPSGFGDGFGSAVAISGDTLVAAAYNEDSNATGVNGNQTNNLASNSGAAYIFTRDGTGAWSQQAYLKASNTGASDMFGIAVAISGDTAVVGASSEDSTVAGGQSNNDAANAGAAYVFTRDGTGAWSQQAFLKASNAQAQDIFGSSVAVSGDTLIVGAYYEASSADGGESDNSTSYSGAAYVFTRSGVTWNQQPYLKASNAGIGDNFGYAVAIDGDSLAVAAPQERSSATGVGGDQDDDSAFGAGAVYISAFVVPPAPDVTLAKTVTPASAQPGQAITYTLTFSNAGNGTATGVVITDSVPVSVTNLSVISSGVVITATGAAPNFIWQVENFAQNAGGVITLTGVLSNPLAAGVFTNTAEIAATGDSNPANNTGSAAISVCGYSATVQNNTDSGAGSLRQAVADVCPGGVISFTLTTPDVITLTTGEIAITKTLTIDGPGKELIAVSGNNASRIFTATAALTIDGVTLRDGNASGSGGAILTTAPLTLTALAVVSNSASALGGAIYNNGGSLTLTDADISGNVAGSSGGAIYNNGGSLTLTNARISGNIGNGGSGGAIYNYGGSAALTNTLFSGNKAPSGGAIYNNSSSLQLTNATLSGNLAPFNPGGAIANNNGNVQLVNGVVWGNGTSGPPGHQIYNISGTTALSYTLIQSGTSDIQVSGGSVTFGPGVITSDPLFVAPISATLAPTTTGNYRLQTGSPAIDSGDNSAVSFSTDLDGNARIQGGTVDMGAYEATPLPDVTLSKSASPPSANAGDAITYTLTFSNNGTAIATDVTITDSVPVSVTNASVAGSSGAVITPTGTAPNFVWQVAELAPSEGGIITLTGVLSNPLAAGVFTNSAAITATDDGNPANNTGVAAILVRSTNAGLVSLVLSSGPLTPAFISTTTSYTAAVGNLTTSVTLTPTASDANATLSVNGTPLGSGEAYTLTPLVVGPNAVSTTVTAEDGITQQTYAITVTRLGADGDWYVDPVGDDANNCHAPGVGYACRTIIGAMNKAANGDRIFIAPATYTEMLVVTKSLTYIGVGGADVTFVSGGGSSRVISVTAGVDVTLDGLSITGGRLSGATPATGAGAGIYNSGNLTLTTTVITNNVASSAFAGTGGGGIYNAAPGVLRLFDSSVISNSGFYGSGLFVAGGAATLVHSTVLTNVVASNDAAGAGLYVDGASTVVTVTNGSTIAGNRVTGTTSASRGGGVFVNAGLLRVGDSTIARNTAGNSGGGIAISPGARTEITASTVFSNAAGTLSNQYGGGIYSLGAVTLTNSTVAGN
ncbi:MAG: cadherin-like beta sandwich domain-containing protein, partial [Caldilinea sp.]|nr:cadherin-like beta sandwich domain-containing protein [Caldilinea sp.]